MKTNVLNFISPAWLLGLKRGWVFEERERAIHFYFAIPTSSPETQRRSVISVRQRLTLSNVKKKDR